MKSLLEICIDRYIRCHSLAHLYFHIGPHDHLHYLAQKVVGQMFSPPIAFSKQKLLEGGNDEEDGDDDVIMSCTTCYSDYYTLDKKEEEEEDDRRILSCPNCGDKHPMTCRMCGLDTMVQDEQGIFHCGSCIRPWDRVLKMSKDMISETTYEDEQMEYEDWLAGKERKRLKKQKTPVKQDGEGKDGDDKRGGKKETDYPRLPPFSPNPLPKRTPK